MSVTSAHILAREVRVEFPIYGSRSRSFKNAVLRAATGGLIAEDAAHHVVVKALNGVSFEFREGDRVGLVGHNGSGKSTLLRVLAGAYEPVAGTIEVQGQIASMLNITLGMDYEATGYENIFVRGVIMGFKPSEIEPLVEEIVAFSELGDYIDMPMRTYSSGMAVRLAFAVSTCVTADILLMDEWLAVGDESFQSKAGDRLRKLVNQAKILVLASHDEALIRSNCNKIMRLSHGELVSFESC
jgi:lipopolysaccharide transport system ATP-binding protein